MNLGHTYWYLSMCIGPVRSGEGSSWELCQEFIMLLGPEIKDHRNINILVWHRVYMVWST